MVLLRVWVRYPCDDPDIYAEENKQKLQECLLKKANVDKRCEAIEDEWMEASEALQELSDSL